MNGDPVGFGATSLVRLSGKGIGLAADRRGVKGDEHLLFWRSEDEGETWEAPVRMTPPGVRSFAWSGDVLLRTSSGRIVLPVYTSLGQEHMPSDGTRRAPGKLVGGHWVSTNAHFFDPVFTAVFVCYSDDEGRTWQRNKDGELMILLDWNATFSS